VGVLAVVWLVLYVAAGSGVAKGTTVLGVAIGGQSTEQAKTTLQRELADEAGAAIPVQASEATAAVQPESAGLALDVDATVAAATARSWNPLHLVSALAGGQEVEPVVSVDRAALSGAVDRLAEKTDRPAVEGSLKYNQDAVPEPVQPVEGLRLARPGAVDALAAAYLVGGYLDGMPVELPVDVDEPEVSSAEVTRVAQEIALPATSGDVTVTAEGASATLTPKDIAAALTFTPDGKGSLQPVLDGEVLHAGLGKQLASVERPARDARFRIRSGTPKVVPSRLGNEVLPETLAAAVLPILTQTGPARTVDVPLEPSEPELSTEEAQALGITERVSTFTTYYPSDFAPRLTNIHRAADLMDRTLVLPGKVFSLNRTVGERTPERGFAAGYIINNGQLEVDFGGGVSQLVTTTFNAAYFAGLEIVEHHPHSFYISRYPEGREATVAWGVKDLRVRNDSPNGILITTSYTNSSVTVNVYGTKRYRIESVKGDRYDIRPFEVINDTRAEGVNQGDCVATEGVSGFRVVVTRLFYEGNTRVKSEEFRTKYEPEHEVRCGVNPDPPPPPDDDEPDTPDEPD